MNMHAPALSFMRNPQPATGMRRGWPARGEDSLRALADLGRSAAPHRMARTLGAALRGQHLRCLWEHAARSDGGGRDSSQSGRQRPRRRRPCSAVSAFAARMPDEWRMRAVACTGPKGRIRETSPQMRLISGAASCAHAAPANGICICWRTRRWRRRPCVRISPACRARPPETRLRRSRRAAGRAHARARRGRPSSATISADILRFCMISSASPSSMSGGDRHRIACHHLRNALPEKIIGHCVGGYRHQSRFPRAIPPRP